MSGSYDPSAAQDVVFVCDSAYNQLFTDARPIKAFVKEAAKLMEHPVESGAVITDHRVILPIEIMLSLVFKPDTYLDMYNQVRSVFNDINTIIVQTNTGTYTNMLIHEMPHEEDPSHFDTIVMQLKLREVLFVTSSTSPLPDAPKNGGNKTGKAASPTEKKAAESDAHQSALHELFAP